MAIRRRVCCGRGARREGRAPVSTEHTGPNEGVDEEGGWAPRFEGRIRTSFENKAHEAGRLIFDLSYRRL